MRFFQLDIVVALLGVITASVNAHPGADHKKEAEEYFLARKSANLPDNLSHCAEQLKKDGHDQRAIHRRLEILTTERTKRGLPTNLQIITAKNELGRRDAPTVLKTDHRSKTKFTPDSKHAEVFANSSCILTPHITEGPYWVQGEFIRSDLRDKEKGQKGVDVILDVQVINVKTCKPIPSVYLEFWHANATGIYSGIVASANGGVKDQALINATFARGIQPTDTDGVARFITFYAGHYGGRSTHYHIASHLNGTLLPNNTFTGTTVSHVGQIFFDQNLSTEVEKTSPYKANTFPVTTNANDMIFKQAAATDDPVMRYSLLGDKIEDGIFGWISLGVDPAKAAKDISPAGVYGPDGGRLINCGGDPAGMFTPCNRGGGNQK